MAFEPVKTAIIHEWLVNYAGSERCVESFVNIWKDAPVFSLVDFLNDEERNLILKGKKAETSFIQKLPFAAKGHRKYLALFPMAVEQFDLSGYDLIISSSHAVAKGVITRSDQLHITYCHTPMRYAWDFYHEYLRDANLQKGIGGIVAKSMLHYLRMWDYSASARVDHFIANSKYIARRIKKVYGRDSEVIYPPVDVEKFGLGNKKEDFYLTASRLVSYKKVDVIVEAFSKMPDKKLVVAGEGSELEKIKAKAGPNIEIIGYQSFEALRELMQRAKAFVYAAEEDFGIIVVEAQACGTPVIAFRKGGTEESVIHGVNGVHFEEQNAGSVIKGVKEFERLEQKFDSAEICRIASGYSRRNFEERISGFVNEKYTRFKENGR